MSKFSGNTTRDRTRPLALRGEAGGISLQGQCKLKELSLLTSRKSLKKYFVKKIGSSEESVGPPWLRQVSHRMIQGDFSGFKRPKTVCLSGSQFQLVV